MRNTLLGLACLILCSAGAKGQQAFGPWIDASQFNKADICLDIQAAIAALPAMPPAPTPGGAVIDARNIAPPASQAYIHCSINPFSITSGVTANTVVLVNGGTSSNLTCSSAGASAGCLGGVVLLPGFTISTDVPWLVPGNWSIIGQGAKVTVIAPSGTASSTFKASYNAGTITGNSSSNAVTGGGTASWTTGPAGNVELGMILTACVSSLCSAAGTSYSNATAVGIVTQISSSTTLNLGSNLQTTFTVGVNPANYVLQSPVLAWATTNTCTSCSGALQNATFGSVIQDVGISCVVNAGGGATVGGCIPFWDQYGQERSQLKRVAISGFLGPGIGIYTSNAQNGGPFDDLQMTSGPANLQLGTTCVEVGGTGVGTQPPMRGIRGLTCTNANLTSFMSFGIGVDINTQDFSLADAHFEDNFIGVEVGGVSSARGIRLSNITGGASLGTVVDISMTCATSSTACGPFATSDINVSNVFQSTSITAAFKDNITGNAPTEAMLGFYSLGDGSGLTSASTRPVLTTSSSVNGNLNALTLGVAGTSTGTLSLASLTGGTASLVNTSTATSTTHTLPNNTGTIAETNFANTWTALQGLSTSGNAATATTAGNVTGTVAIANGGTNATSAAANSIPNASSGTAATWTTTPSIGQTITFNGTSSGSTSPGCVPATTCANGFGGTGVNSIWGKLSMNATGLIFPGTTTVGSLPSASANTGAMIRVSDSTTISSEGQACVGSGSNVALAFSNGSMWKCF